MNEERCSCDNPKPAWHRKDYPDGTTWWFNCGNCGKIPRSGLEGKHIMFESGEFRVETNVKKEQQ